MIGQLSPPNILNMLPNLFLVTDTASSPIWEYRGHIAALTAAFFWAISTTIWSHAGKQIPPLMLNLIKQVIALVFILVTLIIIQDYSWQSEPYIIWLFVISGVIGLGIGDTLYFECINRIGPRLGLLLLFTAPPITAVISWVFIDEKLTWVSWLGIAVTMSGIAWVVTERKPNKQFKRHHIAAGVILGLMSGLMQSIGSVISRAAFEQSDISAISSSFIRLSAGMLILLIWLAVRGRLKLIPVHLKFPVKLWGFVILATFLGTFIGVWLQQVAFDATKAGIAQTLLATSPIFILPLAWLYGEKISWRAGLGAAIALAGIVILLS